MGRLKTISRRTFMIGSAAIAGGVVFGYWKYKQPFDNPLLAELGEGEAALTPYVRIDKSGITVITPRAEMGQGVHTTLAALVAEELNLGLEDINVEHGPAAKAYFNKVVLEEAVPYSAIDTSNAAERMRGITHIPAKFLGMQITGGSTSIPDGFEKMRVAGAVARDALLQAAALHSGKDKSSLHLEHNAVVAADGSRYVYTELAEIAASIELPDDPPALKPSSEWKLLGKSQDRVDVIEKSTGTAEYSIDVRLPDMLHATVRMNPRLGAPMTGFDATSAEGMPGVRAIVPLDSGVAVVATNTWYAFKAAQAIKFEWADAPYPNSTEEHYSALVQALDGDYDSRNRDDGDAEAALTEGVDLEGEYRVPYLAHATMEPLNAVAWLRDGKLDIWAGSQAPTQAVIDGAAIADIDEEDVSMHTTYMGGGFGRRSDSDFVKLAVHVAKAMEGTPVKTTWTREEDTCHDIYRPLALAKFEAKLGGDVPEALDIQLSSPSVTESFMGRMDFPVAGPDIAIVQSAWDQPYGIPNYRVSAYRPPVMMPLGYWRSVGASQNGFFHESIIDEMAHASGADPLEYRLNLITHEPSRRVLEAVAEMSGWGSELPEGHARGVAMVMSFGVPTAEVIEVANTDAGIKLVKAWAAVDVGTALDPRNIEAQVQSGINFGLTAAIKGEITVADGVVEQSNFHDYDGIRMREAPPIEVRILENGERIRGIGEPGTPPAAPALANAIFAATGQRIRELPMQKQVRFA